jgi:hypothetical protein
MPGTTAEVQQELGVRTVIGRGDVDEDVT